jgi:hypothetical protein
MLGTQQKCRDGIARLGILLFHTGQNNQKKVVSLL